MSTGRQTEQGRAERKDLEVGAVDELLVGECVVRARDKEEKNFTLLSPLASLLSTLLLTNNITPFYFLFLILSIILRLSVINIILASFSGPAPTSQPSRPGLGRLMVYAGQNLLRDSPHWSESLSKILPSILPSYYQHLNSNALSFYTVKLPCTVGS